jgi:predicted RecA/RadA family phage recombinase
MASNYVQPGKTLTLTAPYIVASGAGALIGNIFGVALQALAATVAGEFATQGVWSLAKTSGQAWAVGEKIYWDNVNKRCDNLPSAGFVRIGIATAVAANPSSTGYVRLDGVSTDEEAGPAAASVATVGAATITAAQVLGGIYVRDCAGASRIDTLPTAALLVAATPNPAVGDILRFRVINGSDPITEVLTITEGAGGSWDANQTAVSRIVLGGCSKDILIRLTNVTAASEAYVVYA